MRKVFFSFDWDDVWRVSQVRNSWVTKGNYERAGFVDAAEIEKIKKQTDKEIRKWIDKQIEGTSVTCVLIGSKTNKSKWVKYEIEKSIEKKNGLLGIFIHNLKNFDGKTDKSGANPLGDYNGNNFGKIVKNALSAGGIGLGLASIMVASLSHNNRLGGAARLKLAKTVFPLFVIPAAFVGAALELLVSNDDYKIYDWIKNNGYENLDDWIEKAATQVGR